MKINLKIGACTAQVLYSQVSSSDPSISDWEQ